MASRGKVRRLCIGVSTVAAWLLGASCGDHAGGPAAPVPVATVVVSPDSTALLPDSAMQLTALPRDSRGSALGGRIVAWSSADPGVATVSSAGLVRALRPGRAAITATVEGKSGASSVVVLPPPVASVFLSPDSAVLAPGGTAQFAATTRDAAGNALPGRTITWSSADTSRVTVSATGLARALQPGRVLVSASSEGKSGSAVVVVTQPGPIGDVAVLGAQFTQGVQDSDGSIPMVLGGGAAVVNVLLRSNSPAAPMQVVLRLYDAQGTLLRADTAVTRSDLMAAPSFATPSVQFLVPAAVLQQGLQWQILRDPRRLQPDDSAANDVFPRSGPAALATTAVPALTVRFVPIVLLASGSATGDVSSANLAEYLRTVRSIHPLGRIDAHVGPPLATSASFGTPPAGGDAPFWQQLISEIDLARILDPVEPGANWYGIVRPPAGFNNTSYGGFSYVPFSGSDVGAHTRTSASVQLNWFNRPTQARDLVAHELGHTFGRTHAPCGNASEIDPAYPVPGGLIDVPGTDVFSWTTGLTAGAGIIPVTTGDVMGYCFPVWASTYTYRGILHFRGEAVTVAARSSVASPAPRSRVLVIRGTVDASGAVRLEPAFTLVARPVLPERAGPFRVQGLDARGGVLFSYAFEPAILDHAPEVRHFTIVAPVTPEMENALETLVVRGPAGETRAARGALSPEAARNGTSAVHVERAADGLVAANCPPSSQAVLVRSATSGAVLGSAPSADLRVLAPPGETLEILCSDGFVTASREAVAPR